MRGCSSPSDRRLPDEAGVTADRAWDLGPPARVVDQVGEAADLIRRGVDVVLVTGPNAAAVGYPTEGPGRLALIVGPVDDPAVVEAAREMAAELFRARPV